MKKTTEVLISTRISIVLHGKIVKRQKEATKGTGIKPPLAAVIRAMLEEAAAR